ncbi:MAG: MlaE family lipid ABC transporter permease subunit [Sulfurimonas sp.]|uniref:MlaE family lipid ABC transporter permease subunit n=1 Tax=Sulfurimonas sp. TaxID=2022749 RepID=UPI00262638DD|nr:MlaE family lipid ABC transporter permease subunit [Sulfurimonas sp.]MDD2652668.1 MlaE family lipid ABC transporter permease subunit [Sulfurimonas sp.]MDD3450835.1 MlaE family lipid ABC transporter permease subunit [Sulfurimonas sp.]
MNYSSFRFIDTKDALSLKFKGELTLYNLTLYQKQVEGAFFSKEKKIILDLSELEFIDTAGALFLNNLQKKLHTKKVQFEIDCKHQDVLAMLLLVQKQSLTTSAVQKKKKRNYIEKLGENSYKNYLSFLSFLAFMGELFMHKLHYLFSFKSIRYKEMAFEINESAIKAFGIIALTSFLIGVVIAYQSSVQLKQYGANIFIVDMLGLSVLRELSPLITAIVIAGRSGSAFTAQIGAMKITQELEAMQTMGFDPFRFLVLPKIAALMLTMPIMIFVSDVMAIIGGMVVANLDLGITVDMFLDRFSNVIAVRHFLVGIFKGPFFAFLIAAIAIYRGLLVKDDTQSIGFNTTKSVVESIFAVIICDAVFSIAFTNLGI